MTSKEIREKFLEFFKEKGHTIIPSASLIPSETDPTVLFTTAGMHPLVPFLLGEEHPGGRRVANAQKCIRTVDIDAVGDNSHLTFFEMLGNWSFGDPATPDGIGAGYFKKEAIEWSWEFLTSPKWLGLDPDKIAVSVFTDDQDPAKSPDGDNGAGAPFDSEAFEIWKKLGVSEKRIAKLSKENNWWGPAGATGPCGPNTEMFYWVGNSEQVPEYFDPEDSNWMEIWNDVFMEYNKNSEGRFEPLNQKNVDTGMGLERIAMIMQDKNNVFETDLFEPIIEVIKSEARNPKSETKSIRIIADHIKASMFIIGDGVTPSNTGRGYVLRRLLRRARYYYDSIGAEDKTLAFLVESVVQIYKDTYPELIKKKNYIDKIITDEETIFAGHLMFGKKFLDKIIAKEKHITGDNAFLLYSTYGFPFELVLDIAKEKDIKIDIEGFEEKKKQHQELSRTASVGMFKGGLVDAGEQTTKYHTATHILLAAIRKVLKDNNIIQKGSNITSERLRFDFNYPQKLAHEQIEEIENLVNAKIKEKISVRMSEMPKAEALKIVKSSFDASKYDDTVKVYKISDFSIELCGGPHVENTGELGKFKIIKEEASSAGMRRIKAILE